ncbi:MAG: CpaD family pilus assembly protein [Pseudorhodoplanes sp.]
MTAFRSAPAIRRIAIQILATTAIGLSLAGCYTKRDTTGIIPNDYRQRHPIALKEGERTVDVFVGTNRGGLTPAQRADVLAFAQSWRKESTGGIVIDLPTGATNERAAVDALREIRSILGAAGVPGPGVNVRPYAPAGRTALAPIKLNYSRIAAEAGPCGLWPHDIGPADPSYFANKPHWNLGCSTQRNLAAMVDNPTDLVQPRGETPPLAGRRTTVIDKYRKGEATGGAYPDVDKAKISDLGK